MRSAPALLAGAAWTVLALAPAAHGQDTILQNDSWNPGDAVIFDDAFYAGERAAVRLLAPGPFPMQVTRALLILGQRPGTETIRLKVWDDAAQTLDPGALLWSADFTLTSADGVLQEIDLRSFGLFVYGPFRLGVEFLQNPPPSLSYDTDGVAAVERNFVYDEHGDWHVAQPYDIQGDWILRAAVTSAAGTIFGDGFESGGLGAWSSETGAVSVSPAAGMAGTGHGLQAVVSGTSPAYVEDDTPTAQRHYRARFDFDPNGFDPGMGQGHLRTRIFIASEQPTLRRVAAIVLRRQGSTFSLMGRARLDDNTQADTPFVTITDAPHSIELDLQQSWGSEGGSFRMWIDGVPAGTLTGLANANTVVDEVRLGALSVKAGAAGTLYWDEFESTRGSAIAP